MEKKPACFFCGKNEDEIPLVNLTFKGQALWICSTDLPILIHHPEELAEQITAALRKT